MVSWQREIGDDGEAMARRFLEDRSIRVLAVNANVPGVGELDIVGLLDATVIVVEVKTRRRPNEPMASLVPMAKRRRVIAAAQRWLEDRLADEPDWVVDGLRFDVLVASPRRHKNATRWQLTHFPDAFGFQ